VPHHHSRLFCLLGCFLGCLALPATAADYVVDPGHTYANFEVDHLGFSTQRGRFNRTTGSIRFDDEALTGDIDIRIDAASLDTGLILRDEVLRGDQWFDVERYPELRFKSARLIFADNRLAAVDGELTLLGESRPLRLEILRFKCGFNLAARKRGCGADAVGVVHRSEFGMRSGLPFVGDEVRLRIQVEAYPPETAPTN